MVECLLTLRRIYEVERNDGKRSPRRPFALSPRSGTPNVSGHPPLRLSQRHSPPFLATPDVNYQAVQQVQSQYFTASLQCPSAPLYTLIHPCAAPQGLRSGKTWSALVENELLHP